MQFCKVIVTAICYNVLSLPIMLPPSLPFSFPISVQLRGTADLHIMTTCLVSCCKGRSSLND